MGSASPRKFAHSRKGTPYGEAERAATALRARPRAQPSPWSTRRTSPEHRRGPRKRRRRAARRAAGADGDARRRPGWRPPAGPNGPPCQWTNGLHRVAHPTHRSFGCQGALEPALANPHGQTRERRLGQIGLWRQESKRCGGCSCRFPHQCVANRYGMDCGNFPVIRQLPKSPYQDFINEYQTL